MSTIATGGSPHIGEWTAFVADGYKVPFRTSDHTLYSTIHTHYDIDVPREAYLLWEFMDDEGPDAAGEYRPVRITFDIVEAEIWIGMDPIKSKRTHSNMTETEASLWYAQRNQRIGPAIA